MTSRGVRRMRQKSRSHSMVGMTVLGLAWMATAGSTSSLQAQSESVYHSNSAAVAKQQYEEALRAQMLRAQVEQGAPDGFAEEAFAATQAYLEQTADKTYVPNGAERRVVGRTPQAYSSDPVATYATQSQSFASPSDRGNGYRVSATQRPSTQYASTASASQAAMPPVHIAPTQGSTPPRARAATQFQESPNVRQAAPANLQDRIEGLLTRKRIPSQPTLAEPVVAREARAPQSPTYTRATAESPIVQQPNFASVPRRIPTAQRLNQNVSTYSPADFELEQAQEEVAQVGMTEPVVEPMLTAPGQSAMGIVSDGPVPQDHFVAFQNGGARAERPQMSLPTTQSQPRFVGSKGSVQQVEKQISVLNGGPVARGVSSRSVEDSGIAPELILQDPDDNSFGGSLPVPDQSLDNNRVRPLDPLQGRTPPQEDDGVESIEDRLKRIQERDDLEKDLEKRVNELRSDRDEGQEDNGQERSDTNKISQKTCEEFRTQLLSGSIRDIALDMSPPASRIRDQFVAISRSWTDQLGNVIVTGTMVDLRRGYVIVETGTGLQKIPYAKISDADWAAVSEYWQLPELCGLGGGPLPSRTWVPQTVAWNASALCHKPLYFENRQLERYGHSHGPILQPIHSTAHFFVSLATLPYQTAIHPPTECRYALGFYRPGNCAPWLKDPIPISLDGARRQALIGTGLAFIP